MKIVYNPNEELTDEQLKELSEDDFFSYLDQKAAHLKQFARPLGTYETKHFAAWTKGDSLTTEELKKAKELGKIGDDEKARKIAEATARKGGDPKLRDAGIKNIKTNRTQWFD